MHEERHLQDGTSSGSSLVSSLESTLASSLERTEEGGGKTSEVIHNKEKQGTFQVGAPQLRGSGSHLQPPARRPTQRLLIKGLWFTGVPRS